MSLGVAHIIAGGWALAKGGCDDGEEDFEERGLSSFATSGGMCSGVLDVGVAFGVKAIILPACGEWLGITTPRNPHMSQIFTDTPPAP